jgi:HPt (histidine-containing phosphotransfer) domain-containing protein
VGAVGEIRAALKAQDSATAQRIAHSLKGAAANLGANALATAAGSAGVAINTQSEVEPALVEMERTLFAAVAAIQKTLPSAEEAESTLSGNGDPSAVLQPLSRLKMLLEADDSEAAEFILEAQGSFAAVLHLVVRVSCKSPPKTIRHFKGFQRHFSLAAPLYLVQWFHPLLFLQL